MLCSFSRLIKPKASLGHWDNLVRYQRGFQMKVYAYRDLEVLLYSLWLRPRMSSHMLGLGESLEPKKLDLMLVLFVYLV